MFATHATTRHDFADTRAATEPWWALSAFARLETADAAEQMAFADAADRSLLRLVSCAAVATLLLAVASSYGV